MTDFATEKFRELLESDSVTEPTRAALKKRLNAEEKTPRFFDQREFEILKGVCDALAPSKVVSCRFVAGEIDLRLAENKGNGWRYAEMPPDAEVYRTALGELDQIAASSFGESFAALENEQRREIFRRIKNKETGFKFSHDRFLEEICAEFVEVFYSHPLVLEEIGYIGFADAAGWKLGTNAERGMRNAELKRENNYELRITNYELEDSESKELNPKVKGKNPKSKIQNPNWSMPSLSARARAARRFLRGSPKPD